MIEDRDFYPAKDRDEIPREERKGEVDVRCLRDSLIRPTNQCYGETAGHEMRLRCTSRNASPMTRDERLRGQ